MEREGKSDERRTDCEKGRRRTSRRVQKEDTATIYLNTAKLVKLDTDDMTENTHWKKENVHVALDDRTESLKSVAYNSTSGCSHHTSAAH